MPGTKICHKHLWDPYLSQIPMIKLNFLLHQTLLLWKVISTSPCRPGCPFHAIHPCCPEKLLAPWGGYPFLTATPWGGTKILRRLRGGGMHFLRALFPKSTTPHPPNEKFWTVPYDDVCDVGVSKLINAQSFSWFGEMCAHYALTMWKV